MKAITKVNDQTKRAEHER